MFELLTLLVGALMLIGLSTQMGLHIWGAVRRQRYDARERELALRQLAADIERLEAGVRDVGQKATLHWKGYRKFVVRRKRFEDDAQQICSFYLAPHDGKPLPTFEPGQHLVFELNIDGRKQIRCYSLSECPDPRYYRVSIKCLPDGVVSNYFHKHIDEGSILDLKPPRGDFRVDMESDHPVCLIAGGVGITPCLCMLNAILKKGGRREVWFLYGVREPEELVRAQELMDADARYDNIHVRFFISNEHTKLPENSIFYHGRVDIEAVKTLLGTHNYYFYMCGPTKMQEAMVEGLRSWGVPVGKTGTPPPGSNARVFWEHFVPQTPPETPAGGVDPNAPKVTFGRSRKTELWEAGAGNLWAFAKRHGVSIPCGCLTGNCGTCTTALIKGGVDYASPPGCDDVPEGCILACVATPTSDVTLDC